LLQRIVRETPALARTYLVGGGVRDALLGEPVKDFDLEVFGVDYPELVAALGRWGRADLVGRSFGVVKLSTSEGTFDFSLPRRDSKPARDIADLSSTSSRISPRRKPPRGGISRSTP